MPTESPSPNAATPEGSSAAVPSGPSGRPTSVELTISPASSPTAVPVWPPIIAPPSCRSMGASPDSPPRPASACCISSGTSAPSCEGSTSSIELIASTPFAAIGSQSADQTGKVASSHSDLLQASIFLTPEGNVVTSSSHRSASRIASVTAARSLASTLGSPLAAMVCLARFFASSQLTGPPL